MTSDNGTSNETITVAVTEEFAAPAEAVTGEPLGTKLPRPDLGVSEGGEPTYAVQFDASGGSAIYKWAAPGLYVLDASQEMDPLTGGLRPAGSGTAPGGGSDGTATLGHQAPSPGTPSQTSRSVNKRGGSLVDLNNDDFYNLQ